MTPQAHVAALHALHQSVGIQANKLAGVLSTVKVPDDEAATASLEGVLKHALRPPGSWTDLDDGAELEEHLTAILENEGATRLLVEVLRKAVTVELASQVEGTKVTAISAIGEVATKLNEHEHTLEVLHKEAPALIASANMAKNRALKVTGASGLSQPEVLQKWEDSHDKVLKLHSQLISAKDKHTEFVEKLGSSYETPDGSIFTFSGTDAEQSAARKAMREDAKDQKNLQEVKQVAIYKAHGIDGNVVASAKDVHKYFEVPKHLKSGDYEKLKRDYTTWSTDPCVIKAYDLLMHDLEYVFNAVDPIKAMHLLPPSMLDGFQHKPGVTVSEEFKAERQLQNKALFEELYDESSKEIRDWIPQIHSVGQDGAFKVEIEPGDGVRYLYCMLSEHVKFTAADQTTHMTALMNMSGLFAPGTQSTLKSVERARTLLRDAQKVGVMPTYDMCGRMAIKAMEQIDGVRDKLRTNHLLEPEVLSLKHFDQMDCSKIMHTALTVAYGVIEERIKLADAQHRGTRKSKEAGAEIMAMKAGLQGLGDKRQGKDAKRKRAELVKEVAEQYELDDSQIQVIKANLGQVEDFDSQSRAKKVQLIQARALTLANGQTLSEPLLKANLHKLQGGKRQRDDRSKGSKGGRDRAQGGRDRAQGGRDRAHGGRDNHKGGRGRTDQRNGARKCMIKGCNEDPPINAASGRPFALCTGCNEKAKEGKKLVKYDGSEWRQSVAARSADTYDDPEWHGAEEMVSVKVGKEHHKIHAYTLSVLRQANDEGLDVTEGGAKEDWRDNLRAVLHR